MNIINFSGESSAKTHEAQPPIPPDLPKFLHDAKTPWLISPALFERVKKQYIAEKASGSPFVAVQVTNKDPEYSFILRYFEYQRPPNYAIKKILCVYNPDQTKMFEGALVGMETAAKEFSPAWDQEELKAQRAQTIQRWKKSVAPFSSFQVSYSKRVDKFSLCKIVPLWHGSKYADSICKIGFTFFGKHHFFDKSAKKGPMASTDIGFFGSGIYFTNSARYASMYNSGTLLVSWVSMREPYPVVNDVSIPKKGTDMLKLQGKGAYQTYNAHYIPVTSTDPKDPDNMIYHPCHQTESPAWDEYVIFQTNQALPRFVIELCVDLPKAPAFSISNHALKEGSTSHDIVDSLLNNSDIVDALPQEEIAFLNTIKQLSLLKLKSTGNSSHSQKEFDAKMVEAQQAIDKSMKVPNTSDLFSEHTAFLNTVKQLSLLKLKSYGNNSHAQKESDNKLLVAPPKAEMIKASKGQGNNDSAAAPKIVDGPLHRAAAAGNIEEIEKLLKMKPFLGKYLIDALNEEGFTPLLLAAASSHAKACEILIKAGADINATIFTTQQNALHFACVIGNQDVVRLFGKYKQLLEARRKDGDTPLLVAAYSGHAKVCKILLGAGAGINAINTTTKRNVLHIACSAGEVEVVKLFSGYKHLLGSKDGNDYTPLLIAASNDHVENCEVLVKAGADIYATEPYTGWNALHVASRDGGTKVIGFFAQYKPLLESKDKDRYTPLLLATVHGHVMTCELLVKAGADVNAKDLNGDTPLLLAALNGYTKLCEMLLKLGSDVNAANFRGQTALHYACIRWTIKVVSLLVKYKELLEVKEKSGFTPLLVAAYHGHKEVCKILLEGGANIDAIEPSTKRTALHIACSEGKIEVVRLLSRYKHLFEEKDTGGETPFQLAVSCKQAEVVEYLQKEGFGLPFSEPRAPRQSVCKNIGCTIA